MSDFALSEYELVRDKLQEKNHRHYSYGQVQALKTAGKLKVTVTDRWDNGRPKAVNVEFAEKESE
ncbi:MAG: hypothetical protein IJ766_03810 [Clostridia bacterium]|nr:hypothetical protein [Clostridia bacterium]